MPSQNFMKELLSGFQSSYLQSSRNFQREQADKREAQRQREQNLFEQRQAEIEQQQEQQRAEQEKSMIQMLLQPGIDRETYTKGYLQLSKEGRNQLGQLKQEYYPAAKTKIIGGDLYRINSKTGLPDPEPIMEAPPRVINAAWGRKAETGEYGFFRMFDNGDSDFTNPGRAEPVKTTSKSKDSGPESFDDYSAKQFNTAMNQFTRDLKTIEEKKQKIKELQEYLGDENEIKANINIVNILADNAEKSIYALMPKDTKEIIDTFNSKIESVAKKTGISAEAFMDQKKDEMLSGFMNQITPLWKNDEMDDKEYRALSAWAQFKFGYIPGEK